MTPLQRGGLPPAPGPPDADPTARPAVECRYWTRILAGLLVLKILLVAAIGALLVGQSVAPETDAPGAAAAVAGPWVGTLLTSLWVMAALVQYANFRLVRSAMAAQRLAWTGHWLHRPDPLLRLALHLLVNWAVLGVTLAAARAPPDRGQATLLAWVVVAGAAAVWIGFNLQHRRMNRARNLVLSTVLGSALALGAWPLL